jgi:hypothetical protein
MFGKDDLNLTDADPYRKNIYKQRVRSDEHPIDPVVEDTPNKRAKKVAFVPLFDRPEFHNDPSSPWTKCDKKKEELAFADEVYRSIKVKPVDAKICGLCSLPGHSKNKCPDRLNDNPNATFDPVAANVVPAPVLKELPSLPVMIDGRRTWNTLTHAIFNRLTVHAQFRISARVTNVERSVVDVIVDQLRGHVHWEVPKTPSGRAVRGRDRKWILHTQEALRAFLAFQREHHNGQGEAKQLPSGELIVVIPPLILEHSTITGVLTAWFHYGFIPMVGEPNLPMPLEDENAPRAAFWPPPGVDFDEIMAHVKSVPWEVHNESTSGVPEPIMRANYPFLFE